MLSYKYSFHKPEFMRTVGDCLPRFKQFLIPDFPIRWLLVSLFLAIAGCGGIPPNEAGSGDPPSTPETPAPPNFEGIALTVLSLTPGNGITEPVIDRAPGFEALTGTDIKVITAPFDLLYEEILEDFRRGIHNYDIVIIPSRWKGDYVRGGYLRDLTRRVQADDAIEWEDIAEFFREYHALYGGAVYAIPLDGDLLKLYYRRDLLEQKGILPPRTWDEYLELAREMNGRDLNGDGKADYGSCLIQNSQMAPRMLWAVASSFLQTDGTQQGIFFDADTLKPLVNNEAFGKALAVYRQILDYGPPIKPGENFSAGEMRSLVLSGRCALALDWGSLAVLAAESDSFAKDRLGVAILPGSSEVLDRKTGRLVPCDPSTCPHAEDGINYAPYAAFGGWVGAVNGALDEETADAAYAFLSYLSRPEQSNLDVMLSKTGFNPYRISQLTDVQSWVNAGMNEQLASQYLNAIYESLNSPNVVLDLSVPESEVYQEEILYPILIDFISKKILLPEAIGKIESAWEKKTDELGRDRQRRAYCESLKRDCDFNLNPVPQGEKFSPVETRSESSF